MKILKVNCLHIFILSLGLVSCKTNLDNLTPSNISKNASDIYSIDFQFDLQSHQAQQLYPNSLIAFITIDGETHRMKPIFGKKNSFTYDYRIPKDRNYAKYYFTTKYKLTRITGEPGITREVTSKLYELSLNQPGNLSLDSDRAPIRSVVSIFGYDLKPDDNIYINNEVVDSFFVSKNVIKINVPKLIPKEYKVELNREDKFYYVGNLIVDKFPPMSASPSKLKINSGENAVLAISIETDAPKGGYNITTLTNIPDSLVIPNVTIPRGQRSTNITISAKKEGEGLILLRSDGFNELIIPIEIN